MYHYDQAEQTWPFPTKLEPVEILARWTLEGKSYRTLLRHTPIHEAMALIVERYYSRSSDPLMRYY